MTIYYKFMDKIKEDIRDWWKTNMHDCKINKEVVDEFKRLIFHEIIHYKIVKNSVDYIDLILELKKAEGIGNFYYNGSCIYGYPYKFNHPKYYPKFIFTEFKGFLFDIIYDLFSLSIFRNFKYRISNFLKCLISFKVRS